LPQDRRATTLRTDPAILLAVDRCARNLGLSRNQVLDLVLKVAVETGVDVMVSLAASGAKVPAAERST
jgi:hypothetical protein